MLLRVSWRGASLDLRLEPDPSGRLPALARGGGYALSYRGSAPAPLADGLRALAARFEAHPAPGPAALDAIVAEAWPDARLAAVGGPLPRWPSTLRIGAPREGSLWPFDAESLGLELGLRRLLKREQFSEAAARADVAWLSSRGFAVGEPGPPDGEGRRVVFAAHDAAALDEADALEAALRATDGSSGEAGRRLGAALGYPPCCVEAYARVEARDDRALAEALLPSPARPASPLTQWLSAPLGLVSHAPCSVSCEPTWALARRLLDGLDACSPGFAARWRDLARRLHLVSEGRALALDVEAGVVRRAVELTVPEGESLRGWVRDAEELAGRPIEEPLPRALEIEGEGFLVADHRGD